MTKRTTAAIVMGLACAALVPSDALQSTSPPVLVPVVISDSFGGDSLGQWASYPPAQDVGYEPSLTPTGGFEAPGGRALMRVVRPIAPGALRFGFIKEAPLVMSSGAELAFAHRLEPRVLTGAIELGLAGGDGRRYVSTLRASSGGWTSAAAKLADFRDAEGRAPADGTPIEAVYIVANINEATTDITSRFLLDDVRLTASRPAAFDVTKPVGKRIDPWPARVSSVVHHPGSTIAIEVVAPVPVTRVGWSLRGPAGQPIARGTLRDDGGDGDRAGGDDTWSHATAYRVAPSDPRGVWHLEVEGATADGRRIETEVRLLVSPPRAAPHPRLYFDSAEIPAMRARRAHPALSALWDSLRKGAAASRQTGAIAHGGQAFARLDTDYLLPSLLAYFDVLNRARARIGSNAAVGFIDEDRAARDAARTALLEVCRWETWVAPWFGAHGQHTYYPVGQLASAVALAYDLLYDDLSVAERRSVRRALTERAILPTWHEYVLDNRVMADTSNWISHTVGGAIIAAAAIFGDGSPEEDEALALPLNGLLMKIEDHMAASFLADGSYGEGISYLEFDLETLGPMLWAAERVFGQSYWQTTHVLESLQYPLHTLAEPIAESLDMGDTHPPAGHSIGSIVARSEDPAIRWYGSRFARRAIFDFLFFDERIAPAPPAGFGSRWFKQKGDVVLRSGWDADAGLVLFRAGPTFNHNHADQGSFQFRAFGETLVTEAGWSDYYKDPYYETFFTQAAGHNTLLVNDNPASQEIADTAQFSALNRHPRITDATLSPFHDAVGSDLASVYRGSLESYTRRLAYLKPDYLVVFDRVRASEPSRLTWRLHVRSKDGLTVQGAAREASATYAGARATVSVRPLSSTNIRLSIGDGHIPYPIFAARTPETVPPQPAYLDIATTQPVQDAWILLPLLASRSADAAPPATTGARPINAPGWTGMEMARNGGRVVVGFSTATQSRQTDCEGWRTDADAFIAEVAGTDVRRLSAQRTRTVGFNGRTLIDADGTIGVALEYRAGGVSGVVDADSAVRVRLRVRAAPTHVTVNGRVVGQLYDRRSGAVTLNVPGGSHRIAISWRRGR
jgi:hypothetical protein